MDLAVAPRVLESFRETRCYNRAVKDMAHAIKSKWEELCTDDLDIDVVFIAKLTYTHVEYFAMVVSRLGPLSELKVRLSSSNKYSHEEAVCELWAHVTDFERLAKNKVAWIPDFGIRSKFLGEIFIEDSFWRLGLPTVASEVKIFYPSVHGSIGTVWWNIEMKAKSPDGSSVVIANLYPAESLAEAIESLGDSFVWFIQKALGKDSETSLPDTRRAK
ncbi:hypothetical protein GQ44DRAFT_830301 [Phaeosphaeriaceae sp. PMI808]|nr:hypothetical protein GQ44DRAFT_830301 [Phaeosphaeriaceae sp. PMI808]